MAPAERRLFLPDDAWNGIVLAAFLALWAVSCIRVPYPKYFWLQHVPTVAVIAVLVVVQNRLQISRLSYTLILAFMLFHVLGARYLYSYVPYDDWSERLLGLRINDHFGFERNHYDRLVHFAFGLLLVLPLWEFCEDRLRLRAFWTAAGAICIVLAASAAYEIAEWAVAMIFAPDWAEAYNGQQGDAWDAQRDMALAWAGSILGVGFVAVCGRRSWSRKTSEVKGSG
jgi:putative membrane protein